MTPVGPISEPAGEAAGPWSTVRLAVNACRSINQIYQDSQCHYDPLGRWWYAIEAKCTPDYTVATYQAIFHPACSALKKRSPEGL
jgi:hypothetical protein